MEVDPVSVRRWLAGQQAAERRSLDERARRPLDPAAAVEVGLDLIGLAAAQLGWPLPERAGRAEEDAEIMERWRRLRAHYRHD